MFGRGGELRVAARLAGEAPPVAVSITLLTPASLPITANLCTIPSATPSGDAEANRRGIPTTGTLGVLRAAAIGLDLDLPSALSRLAATNFRVAQSLIEDLLRDNADRRRQWNK